MECKIITANFKTHLLLGRGGGGLEVGWGNVSTGTGGEGRGCCETCDRIVVNEEEDEEEDKEWVPLRAM